MSSQAGTVASEVSTCFFFGLEGPCGVAGSALQADGHNISKNVLNFF